MILISALIIISSEATDILIMKIKFGVFCLYLFISFKLYAKSWEQYPKSDSDLEKNSIIQSAIKLNTEQEKLALIKFYMINGNL